ncbi:MAG TPA: right-handed parallel beta-helix repeat-containing protein [Fibrobacteria bacterium]|nr:right-handed parallel beta-helix repeat-containing protein [Fibrobacteria bacterium]
MVHFENVQYWEVSHLDLTNKYGTETWSCGVLANNSGSRGSHIYTKNCVIHEITIGGAAGAGAAEKKLGGIYYNGAFDDILIEGNVVSYAGRTGISTGSGDPSRITGLVIRNNSVSYSAGDAIVLRGALGAKVEHNVVHHCGYGKNGTQTEWSAGIWGGWRTRDAVYQYNEAYNHFYPKGDGEGYDIDTYSYRTIFQYNYSHDNEGGFMLTMGGDTDSSMMRYNVSLNEVVGDFRGGKDIWVYNNVWARTDGITSALHNRYKVNATYVYNNIFYNPAGSVYSIEGAKEHDYNLFYPSGPAEPHGIQMDPLFVNPPSKAPLGRMNITGLKLKPNSPAIDKGKEIPGNGGLDYWGNKVPNGKPDIGAHEFYDGTGDPIRSTFRSPGFLPATFTSMADLRAYLDAADQTLSIGVYDLRGVPLFTGTAGNFKQWRHRLEGRGALRSTGMRVIRISPTR